MKKHILYAVFTVASLSAVASMAQAADGTISITGEITAQTCTINGGGTGAKDFTVALPKVSASTLTTAGMTSGSTPFSIAVSGCTPASGSIHAFFENGPTTDSTTGNLTVTGANASLVQIQLQNSDGSAIKAGFADASQNSKAFPIADGAGTLSYKAQYYALDQAVAGPVNSQVVYTLAYQ